MESGVLHTASPGLPPMVQNTHVPQQQDFLEPEPLTEVEIAEMRHRAVEMTDQTRGCLDVSARERELLDMVVRLTESSAIDPAQLVEQATSISRLTLQRDYLFEQLEEERKRMLSEKDGWERMAEALISRQNKPCIPSSRDPDAERSLSVLEAENRVLREKLRDTQTRLSSLEHELIKLKPIFLMQSLPLLSPISSPDQFSTSHSPYTSLSSRIKSKKQLETQSVLDHQLTPEEPTQELDITQEHRIEPQSLTQTEPQQGRSAMEGIEPTTAITVPQSGVFVQFQATPPHAHSVPKFSGDHYRKPQVPAIGGPLTAPSATLQFQLTTTRVATSPQHQQPDTLLSQEGDVPAFTAKVLPSSLSPNPQGTDTSSSAPLPPLRRSNSRHPRGPLLLPLTSDARAEHLLLAARKIGKERVTRVAGLAEKEREKEPDETQGAGKEDPHLFENIRPAPRPSYYRDDTPRDTINPQTPVTSPQHPVRPPLHSGMAGSPQKSPITGTSHLESILSAAAPKSHGTAIPPQLIVRTPNRGFRTTGTPGPANLPSTPLSSLLDALRMMDDSGKVDNVMGGGIDNGASGASSSNPSTKVFPREGASVISLEKGKGKGRVSRPRVKKAIGRVAGELNTSTTREAKVVEQPSGRPVMKRRRIGALRALVAEATTENYDDEENPEGSGRVKSALDVLADQAAAAVDQDGSGDGRVQTRELVMVCDVEEKEGKKVLKGKSRSKTQLQGLVHPLAKQGSEDKGYSKPAMMALRPSSRPRTDASPCPADDGDCDTPEASARTRRGKTLSAARKSPAIRRPRRRESAFTVASRSEDAVFPAILSSRDKNLDDNDLSPNADGNDRPSSAFLRHEVGITEETVGQHLTEHGMRISQTTSAFQASERNSLSNSKSRSAPLIVVSPTVLAEQNGTPSSPDSEVLPRPSLAPHCGLINSPDLRRLSSSEIVATHSVESLPLPTIVQSSQNNVSHTNIAPEALQCVKLHAAVSSLHATAADIVDTLHNGIDSSAVGDQQVGIFFAGTQTENPAPQDEVTAQRASLLVDGDSAELRVTGDLGVDTKPDVDADAEPEESGGSTLLEDQGHGETASRTEICAGSLPPTEFIGYLPFSLSHSNAATGSHEVDGEDNCADTYGDADVGSEADAEGEVDVDAEGEIDPEVETQTIFPPPVTARDSRSQISECVSILPFV